MVMYMYMRNFLGDLKLINWHVANVRSTKEICREQVGETKYETSPFAFDG